MIKKYRIGFDIWGLIIFIIIMVPNFIWFVVPAPNDIFRGESITETVDAIASICQVLMVMSLRRWTKGYTIKQPNMDCQPTEITALMRHRAVFS